ncbi:hypothetical protein C5167_033322 [Papaver somniferum]|uniref:Uncharacterized protein n=1 Tax=Papaver somniferum TaxID=3469 RepID=A0A4Y7KDX2_PAPSO|nr:hypothetical protein C5167_033322 [Papaver somniferum]
MEAARRTVGGQLQIDSLQGKVPGFHPCRSPRIIEQQQRDAHLERCRVHCTIIRDSMTEVDKEALP